MKMNDFNVNSTTVDELQSFHFLNNPMAQSELPLYKADIDPEVDILKWWKIMRNATYVIGQLSIVLVHPSSAAAEHVFSVLQNSFTGKQRRALENLH